MIILLSWQRPPFSKAHRVKDVKHDRKVILSAHTITEPYRPFVNSRGGDFKYPPLIMGGK